ncbi:hypothetical protein [Streptomyces sp. NPDC004658]|uniref:hypothetical protein n=1 Tax=Streptomyces sp. NPDC004658 TaxID=3154672 RepID=UPI0033A1C702
MTARLEILGQDDAWHEAPGIAAVELHEETPLDLNEAVLVSAVDFARMQIAEYERQLHQPCARPRPSRPAWQSPYGPQPRRR